MDSNPIAPSFNVVTASAATRLPTYFIPHGGGPCFFMPWDPPNTWEKMGDWLRDLHNTVGSIPKAIIVISAHWEEDQFTILSNLHPPLIYDYTGFPAYTYKLQYPALGSPRLALQIQNLLTAAKIPSKLEEERGFDHGVFIPFKLIYPHNNIPVVQISLKKNLNPAEHIAMGKAIAPLRDQGVLIVGSGMSYHNLRVFINGETGANASEEFDAWLTKAVTQPQAEKRNEILTNWEKAPSARAAHPREEHLIPLMVVAGAAGEDLGKRTYSESLPGMFSRISGFQFG